MKAPGTAIPGAFLLVDDSFFGLPNASTILVLGPKWPIVRWRPKKMKECQLRAPFPYFGGKSKVAQIVWEWFGDDLVQYIEPFCGSAAVLLGSPHDFCKETINDFDCWVTNFWRAVRFAPQLLAERCHIPMSELDLHSMAVWCKANREDRAQRYRNDPYYVEIDAAAWFVMGMSGSIGTGFIQACKSKPNLTHTSGVFSKTRRSQLPKEFGQLAERLRYVNICCGSWERVVTRSVWNHPTPCGVFLDPPYKQSGRTTGMYANDDLDIAGEVEAWCIGNTHTEGLRICLAGYEDDYNLPGWTKVKWKANGGYGLQSNGPGRENAARETLWFSPQCQEPQKITLF